MSAEETKAALKTAVRIAFRIFEDLTETDREAVLVALIELADQREAEFAVTMLFHLREQRKTQLQLRGLIFPKN